MCCLRPQRKGKTGDEADSSRMIRSLQDLSSTSRGRLDSHHRGMTVSRDSRGKAGHKESSFIIECCREEVCERTGFESRKDEECQEVKEIQCEQVEVTRFRTEIRSECRTKKDQVKGFITGHLGDRERVLLLLSHRCCRPAMSPAKKCQPRSVFHQRSKSMHFNILFRVMFT